MKVKPAHEKRHLLHKRPEKGSGEATYRARCMASCMKLLQGLLYMSASSKGSGETAIMRRLACAFTAHLCDKYNFLMLS